MTPRRVLVAGASGSGKTTLAARIAGAIGTRHVEIDGLHWHADWAPDPGFEAEAAALAAGDARVTEWQYPDARPLLAARADLLVWVDLPRWRVLIRVVRRTIRRRLRRELLWGANREPPLRTFFTDPDHIVRWSMTSFGALRPMLREALAANPDLLLIRVRGQRDAARLLHLLAADALRPSRGSRGLAR